MDNVCLRPLVYNLTLLEGDIRMYSINPILADPVELDGALSYGARIWAETLAERLVDPFPSSGLRNFSYFSLTRFTYK